MTLHMIRKFKNVELEPTRHEKRRRRLVIFRDRRTPTFNIRGWSFRGALLREPESITPMLSILFPLVVMDSGLAGKGPRPGMTTVMDHN